VPNREEVIDALRVVEDPELGMDIVELGLLYDVEVENSKVHVIFTLTSMGCPVGPMLEEQIRAHMGSAVEPGQDVRGREVHPGVRLGVSAAGEARSAPT
jgi:metal-sulfur cluster biosynthetic enzyme